MKLSKTQNGIEKLFDLLGSAGAIGALFKVNCFDLLLINYSKTGSLLEQILSDDQDVGASSEDGPKRKKKKTDPKFIFYDLAREVVRQNSGLLDILIEKLDDNSSNLDEETVRYIFGLKGGTSNEFNHLLRGLKEMKQTGFNDFHKNHKVTKLKLLSNDCNNSDFVSICGIQLRRGNYLPSADDRIIPLASPKEVLKDLRSICVGVSLKNPVLVSGRIGSGKTHLIRFVSQETNQKLVCYQLSEETDAQSLIGGYVQSEDGSFKWRAGPLAQAAHEGEWILLEDIHQAAGDCFPLIVQEGFQIDIKPHAYQKYIKLRLQGYKTINCSNISIENQIAQSMIPTVKLKIPGKSLGSRIPNFCYIQVYSF